MDKQLEQILYKLRCGWSDKPTDETTALLIHREDPTVRVYLHMLSTRQLNQLLLLLPTQFAVFKHRVFFQTPVRNTNAKAPGFVAFNVGNIAGEHPTDFLFGITYIPRRGAWDNGGDWKSRAIKKMSVIGNLPDGLLFDSSVIVSDITDYILGL